MSPTLRRRKMWTTPFCALLCVDQMLECSSVTTNGKIVYFNVENEQEKKWSTEKCMKAIIL
ncbi:hypothetical protein BLOT_002665 [Blomia tropicalis]|nr:hypothetical protein BLOT_002665 [Blomia tropicalis]